MNEQTLSEAECQSRISEVETRLNRSVGQYKAQVSKIKPVFEALQTVVQREIVLDSEVEPAINAYCDRKSKEATANELKTANSEAVKDVGLEAGRIAVMAVYATPLSILLLPILNGVLVKVGLDVTIELVQLIPLVTAILKSLDRSIHEYGKLIGNELLTKAIARF